MPYRHAHWWVAGLLALSGVAFWSGYLSQLSAVPLEFHLHGIVAALWMVLVAVQSWSIHHRQRDLHRTLGLTSFALFPCFLAGSSLVAVGMARRFLDHSDPFDAVYAARLAPLDAVAIVGIVYFFFMALRWRREVHRHARYMLGTLIFLLNPVIGRVLTDIPPLKIDGPDQLYLFADAVRVGNLTVLALLFILHRAADRHGKPFIEAGVLVAIQMLLFETIGPWSAWEHFYAGLASVSAFGLALTALATGVIVTVAGRQAGGRPRHPPVGITIG